MSRRAFLVAGLVVALLLAGVGSYYASSHPDGLERVAEQVGLGDGSSSSGDGGPFADYRTEGVEDDRLSGGLAGVAGALVTLLLAGGLVLVVRRTRPRASDREHAPHESSDAD